jgi:alkaline phosphatase
MNRRLLVVFLVFEFLLIAGLLYYFIGPRDKKDKGVERTAQLLRVSAEKSAERLPLIEGDPSSLVLVIGDGMGFSAIEAARALSQGFDGRLFLERLPITGWQRTRSLNELATDSGAAATALATGRKTRLGRVGVDAEGQPLRGLFEVARDAGKKIGILTDSYLWDATPAGFLAHQERRKATLEVALDYARSGADLLIGTEAGDFVEDDRDDTALLGEFKKNGYQIVRHAADLATVPAAAKVLVLLPADGVTPRQGPSHLADLTAAALARLASADQGFVLLIETEETDTGGHAHDLERVVGGVVALDAAVARVADFIERERRTLMIVTADHETGGLAVLGGKVGEPLRFTWATKDHTAGPVPIFAFGPGARALAGVHENTDLPRILAERLGLEHFDPDLPSR